MNSTFEIILFVILSIITLIFLVTFIQSLFKKTQVTKNNIRSFVLSDVSSKLLFDSTGIEKITTRSLDDNRIFFEVLFQIKKGLDLAQSDPYIIDSISNYLQENMLQGEDRVKDYLLPIYNHLAESGKIPYRHFIGRFFNYLRNEKLIRADELIKNIKESGNSELIESLLEYDIKSNESLSKENMSLLLDLTENTDNTFLIRKYADFLADLFMTDEQKVTALLSSIIPVVGLINVKDFGSSRNQHLYNFLTKFFIKIFINSAGNFDRMEKLLKIVAEKNEIIIDAILEVGEKNIINRLNPVKAAINPKIKERVFGFIEESGINQWNQGIGNIQTGRSINNYFFVDKNGITQRDLLFEYLPFLVDIYNEKYDKLYINKDSGFYTLSLKMISFAPYSVVGYISTLGLIDVIYHNYEKEPWIVQQIASDIYSDNESAKFFLFILSDNILKIPNQKEAFYKEGLNLAKQFIIPDILGGKIKSNIFYFLDNKTVDVETNWHLYKEVVDFVLTKAETGYIKGVEEKISYCAYLPDLRIGMRLFSYFIDTGLYKRQQWKNSFIKLASALYSRNSILVKKTLAEYKIETGYFNEWMLLNSTEKESSEIREARSYQTNWNDFLIYGLIKNRRLKLHIIRDLIGGLTQSNSVEDFSKEFRRFILQTLKTLILGETHLNRTLTVEEIVDLTESKRQAKGKIHIISEKIK